MTNPSLPEGILQYPLYTPFLTALGLQTATVEIVGVADPTTNLLIEPNTFLKLLSYDSEFVNFLTIQQNPDDPAIPFNQDYDQKMSNLAGLDVLRNNIDTYIKLLATANPDDPQPLYCTVNGLHVDIQTTRVFSNRLTANFIRVPTELSGNLVKALRLSASNLIADAAAFASLTAFSLSAQDFTSVNSHLSSTLADTVTANYIQVSALSANYLELKSADHTCLTVHQSSVEGIDVAKFYYGDSYETGENIALIIKGYGNPEFYSGGYVGILTDDPTVELEVNGDILAKNITGSSTVSSARIIGGSGRFDEAVIIDSNLTVIQDLSVYGDIYGNLKSNGTTIFDTLSVSSLTSTDIVATNISARRIVMTDGSGGSSDLWTNAYYVPVAINLMINGGESNITAGPKGFIQVPYDMIIGSWSMYADVPSATDTIMFVLSTNSSIYPNTGKIYNTDPFIPPGEITSTSLVDASWSAYIPAGTVLKYGVSGASIPGDLADPEATLLTLCLSGRRK